MNCTNEPLEDVEGALSEPHENTVSSGSEKSDILLQHLIQQMTQMNSNFERMDVNQDRIMTRLENQASEIHAPGAAARSNQNVHPSQDVGISRPEKHITQAQNGEFINLCDFLPNIDYTSGEMEPIIENGSV
jgi:hypothetical protein